MLLRRCVTLFVIGLLALASSGGALAAGSGPIGPTAIGSAPAGGGAITFAFTYQGELHTGSSLVNATCNFQFSLFDSNLGGNRIGPTLSGALAVVAGRFTAYLNFGPNPVDGNVRWLAVSVQCPPDSGFTPLLPRQPLTAAPLALALPGLRTEPNVASPNVIGGYSGNIVDSGIVGATIGGGGNTAQINEVAGNYGTVGGGRVNRVGADGAAVDGGEFNYASGHDSTIAGGESNNATSEAATVAGGQVNTASGFAAAVGGGQVNHASGGYAVIAGGLRNTASGLGAFIGGGGWDGSLQSGNIVTGVASVIGGGLGNQVTGGAPYGTIGGGISNTVSGVNAVVAGGKENTANGPGGVVGGGFDNTASGINATVAGGQGNTASGYGSFAGGFGAQAVHDGAFVWNDDTGGVLTSKHPNQFLVRASGGITMVTNSAAGGTGAVLAAGSNSWSMLSDRNSKANFDAVDGLQVLNALAGIPIQTWNYKTQAAGIRHMGPMAQDFYSAFGVGENDTTISTVDGQGVALAAIQGLYQLVQQKDAQLAALRDTSANQQAQLSALQASQAQTNARLAALETRATASAAPGAPAPAQLPLTLPWLLLAGLVLLNVGGVAGYLAARRQNPEGWLRADL